MTVRGRVAVLGSINLDLVVEAERLPGPGETVGGGRFGRHFGGKGANQAVAARRYGAPVSFHGCVGDDEAGRAAIASLAAEEVDTTGIAVSDGPTGIALIVVDRAGRNQIAVAPGANDRIESIGPDELHGAGVLLASFEVPARSVRASAAAAARRGWTIVLNPAPARLLSEELCALRPLVTPNEHELAELTGTDGIEAGARELAARTRAAVVVTLGARGAIVVETGRKAERIEAPAVPVRDTTGAGDVFNGVLAAAVAGGIALAGAAMIAVAAAALSVGSPGARSGTPTRAELEAAFPGLVPG